MEETLRYINILCGQIGANFIICLLEAFNSFLTMLLALCLSEMRLVATFFWSQLSKTGGNCPKQIWQVWYVEWLLLIAAPCLSCLCQFNFVFCFCICLCHFFFASIINLSSQTGWVLSFACLVYSLLEKSDSYVAFIPKKLGPMFLAMFF